MTENDFWNIIDSSRESVFAEGFLTPPLPDNPGDEFLDRQEAKLKQILRGMTPEEVLDFEEQFARQRYRAYRYDVWGAAYLMEGGCSDDGFMDFRSTLISLGKELFTRALNDPDSLAEMIDRPEVPFLQSEGFQYVAMNVYKEMTGRDLCDDCRRMPHPEETADEGFDFNNGEEMSQRYPKLAARFPENLG